MEDLVKRRKKYGSVTLLLIAAQYLMAKAGEIIIATGGVDHISAVLFVWLKTTVTLALVGCFVMWVVTWMKVRRLASQERG